MLLEKRARSRIFRAFLPENIELLGGQDSLPLLLGLGHLEDFRRAFALGAPNAVACAEGGERDSRRGKHELPLGDHGKNPRWFEPGSHRGRKVRRNVATTFAVA